MSKVQHLVSSAAASVVALSVLGLGATGASAATAAPRVTPDASVSAVSASARPVAAAAVSASRSVIFGAAVDPHQIRYPVPVGAGIPSPRNPAGSTVPLAGLPFSPTTHQPIVNAPGIHLDGRLGAHNTSLDGRWDPNNETYNQYAATYAVTYRVGGEHVISYLGRGLTGSRELCFAKNKFGLPVFWNCGNVDGLPPFQLTPYPAGYEIAGMQLSYGDWLDAPVGARVMGPIEGTDAHDPRNWIGIDQDASGSSGPGADPDCGAPMEGNDAMPYCATGYTVSADHARAGQTLTVTARGDRAGLKVTVYDSYDAVRKVATKVRTYVSTTKVVTSQVKKTVVVKVKVKVKTKDRRGRVHVKTVTKKVKQVRTVTVSKRVVVKVPKDVVRTVVKTIPTRGPVRTCTTPASGTCTIAYSFPVVGTSAHHLIESDGHHLWDGDDFIVVN